MKGFHTKEFISLLYPGSDRFICLSALTDTRPTGNYGIAMFNKNQRSVFASNQHQIRWNENTSHLKVSDIGFIAVRVAVWKPNYKTLSCKMIDGLLGLM